MAPESLPPAAEDAVGLLLRRYVRAAGGAFSRNTERAVRSDLSVYVAWCARRGLGPLPGSPETVAAFVDDMAESRAPATVRRYVSSVVAACGAAAPGEAARDRPVELALARMHRRKGRRQRQAQGLTWPLRQRMLDASGDRLIDARNRALLAVSYDAMLRRGELTALQVADMIEEPGGSATLLVRRSKTDPEGEGQFAYLAPDTVLLARDWLGRAGIAEGRLFRSVALSGRLGTALDPSQVPRILKGMAARAGLPETVVRGLSGHSARVGAAQDMIAAGIELPAILQAGRWKSAAMVSRYGERLLARRSGAAQLARLQGRE